MRHSNQIARGRRLPRGAAGLAALGVAIVVAAGCGGGQAATPPSAAPTPSPTPDPHLTGQVTADQMYNILVLGKLGFSATNANLGRGNPDVVKQINGTIGGWPVRITEYRSSTVLTKALGWSPDSKPKGEEAPYAWAAMNVLIQFGPISAKAPAKPDPARQDTAAKIVALLDPLLWPIAQHSVVAIPARSAEPTVAPSGSLAPAPSAKPSKKP